MTAPVPAGLRALPPGIHRKVKTDKATTDKAEMWEPWELERGA